MSSKLPPEVIDEFMRRNADRRGRLRCRKCSRKFMRSEVHIDHIKPEVDFPHLRHDPDNLQPLCIADHKAKTAKEAAKRARGRRTSATGVPPAVFLLGPLALGLAMVYYAFLAVTGQSEAATALAYRVPTIATVAVVAVGGFYAARWWAGKAEAPTAAPGPSEALTRARDEAQRFLGDKAEVKASGDAPESFTITYAGTGFPDSKDEQRAAFVAHMSAKMGVRLKATWLTSLDKVSLTKRPDLPALIPHPGFAKRPWHHIPIGPSTVIDFLKTAHVLVVGATGSGKTVVLRGFVEAFLHAFRSVKAHVWLGDPKMIELLGFEDIEGVEVLAATDEELFDLPIKAQAEMYRRFKLFREKRVPLESHPVILLLVDEYEEYVKRMEAYWPTIPKEGDERSDYAKKPGMKNPALAAMASVLAMARRAHIHVVIGTQRPDASWFGGSARDNLQARIAVGNLKLDAARMAFDSSEYGRDVPAGAKGRITVQLGDGEVYEDQAYWVPDRTMVDPPAEDQAILARLDAA